MYAALLRIYPWIIWAVPPVVALLPVQVCASGLGRVIAILVAPVVFVVAYVGLCGVLSLPFQSAIRTGTFRRDLASPDYARRRLYGYCWTSVYYFTPLYHFVLGVPFLRKATFRLFGYRGSLDFTVYPDTWIRDLPLLDLGPGAYVSNRATLGTNIVLTNGLIHVDGIKVGKGTLIGHLAMLGPGVVLEENVEVGPGTTLGMRVHVGARAKVGACCAVGHRVRIGERARIGHHASIGAGATLDAHASVVDAAHVVDGALVKA